MADSTIDGLVAGSAPNGTVEFPGWQSTDMFKFLLNDMRGWDLNPSPVSAAGTDQSGATALSNSFWVHDIGTVGSGAGVKLTALSSFVKCEFRWITVLETAANSCLLYPPSGGKFNNDSVNSPILLEVGQSIIIGARSTINWRLLP
jgi:hypothetical protein